MSKGRFSLTIRVLAAVLVVTFLSQELGLAAVDFKPSQFPVFQKPLVSFELPKSVATVGDTFRGSTGKTLVLIQDAHTNESGQLNISKALETILRKEKIRLVFLEAADGNNSLAIVRGKATLEKRKRTAREYLRKGVLDGSEYLDMTSDVDFIPWGVEDKTLYWQALKNYEKVAKGRERFQGYLDQVELTVNTLKPEIYGLSLAAFDEKRQAFLAGKMPLTDYLEALIKEGTRSNTAITGYPHLAALSSLREQEKAIDFIKANEEQAKASLLMSDEDRALLKEAASKDASDSPFRISGKEDQTRKAFYALLEEALAKAGGEKRSKEFPELSKYFDYLRAAEAVDPRSVLEEQKLLEKQIYDARIKTEEERGLHRSSEALRFLRSLFDLMVMPEEFNAYKADKDAFGIAALTGFLNRRIMDRKSYYERFNFLEEGYGDYVKSAEEFYRLTYARDEAFVSRALSMMEKTGDSKAVLMAGGYHTPNLAGLLKEKGISYIVVTPQVLRETNRKKYENLLLGQTAKDIFGKDIEGDVHTMDAWEAGQVPTVIRSIIEPFGVSVTALAAARLSSAPAGLGIDVGSAPVGARLAADNTPSALSYAVPSLNIAAALSLAAKPLAALILHVSIPSLLPLGVFLMVASFLTLMTIQFRNREKKPQTTPAMTALALGIAALSSNPVIALAFSGIAAVSSIITINQLRQPAAVRPDGQRAGARLTGVPEWISDKILDLWYGFQYSEHPILWTTMAAGAGMIAVSLIVTHSVGLGLLGLALLVIGAGMRLQWYGMGSGSLIAIFAAMALYGVGVLSFVGGGMRSADEMVSTPQERAERLQQSEQRLTTPGARLAQESTTPFNAKEHRGEIIDRFSGNTEVADKFISAVSAYQQGNSQVATKDAVLEYVGEYLSRRPPLVGLALTMLLGFAVSVLAVFLLWPVITQSILAMVGTLLVEMGFALPTVYLLIKSQSNLSANDKADEKIASILEGSDKLKSHLSQYLDEYPSLLFNTAKHVDIIAQNIDDEFGDSTRRTISENIAGVVKQFQQDTDRRVSLGVVLDYVDDHLSDERGSGTYFVLGIIFLPTTLIIGLVFLSLYFSALEEEKEFFESAKDNDPSFVDDLKTYLEESASSAGARLSAAGKVGVLSELAYNMKLREYTHESYKPQGYKYAEWRDLDENGRDLIARFGTEFFVPLLKNKNAYEARSLLSGLAIIHGAVTDEQSLKEAIALYLSFAKRRSDLRASSGAQVNYNTWLTLAQFAPDINSVDKLRQLIEDLYELTVSQRDVVEVTVPYAWEAMSFAPYDSAEGLKNLDFSLRRLRTLFGTERFNDYWPELVKIALRDPKNAPRVLGEALPAAAKAVDSKESLVSIGALLGELVSGSELLRSNFGPMVFETVKPLIGSPEDVAKMKELIGIFSDVYDSFDFWYEHREAFRDKKPLATSMDELSQRARERFVEPTPASAAEEAAFYIAADSQAKVRSEVFDKLVGATKIGERPGYAKPELEAAMPFSGRGERQHIMSVLNVLGRSRVRVLALSEAARAMEDMQSRFAEHLGKIGRSTYYSIGDREETEIARREQGYFRQAQNLIAEAQAALDEIRGIGARLASLEEVRTALLEFMTGESLRRSLTVFSPLDNDPIKIFDVADAELPFPDTLSETMEAVQELVEIMEQDGQEYFIIRNENGNLTIEKGDRLRDIATGIASRYINTDSIQQPDSFGVDRLAIYRGAFAANKSLLLDPEQMAGPDMGVVGTDEYARNLEQRFGLIVGGIRSEFIRLYTAALKEAKAPLSDLKISSLAETTADQVFSLPANWAPGTGARLSDVKVSPVVAETLQETAQSLGLEIPLGEMEEALGDLAVLLWDTHRQLESTSFAMEMASGSVSLIDFSVQEMIFEGERLTNIELTVQGVAGSSIKVADAGKHLSALRARERESKQNQARPQDLVSALTMDAMRAQAFPVRSSSIEKLVELPASLFAGITDQKEMKAQAMILASQVRRAAAIAADKGQAVQFAVVGAENIKDGDLRAVLMETVAEAGFLSEEQARGFRGIVPSFQNSSTGGYNKRDNGLYPIVDPVESGDVPGWVSHILAAVSAAQAFDGSYESETNSITYGNVKPEDIADSVRSFYDDSRSDRRSRFDNGEWSSVFEGAASWNLVMRYRSFLPVIREVALNVMLQGARLTTAALAQAA